MTNVRICHVFELKAFKYLLSPPNRLLFQKLGLSNRIYVLDKKIYIQLRILIEPRFSSIPPEHALAPLVFNLRSEYNFSAVTASVNLDLQHSSIFVGIEFSAEWGVWQIRKLVQGSDVLIFGRNFPIG